MSLEEFQRWCEALHLPAETVDLMARSRFSPPARRTQERAGNEAGIFPSRKMGVTIQFESQIELGAIYLMEYDAGVVEFYDQPAPAFKLSYQTRSGGQAAPFHTPDFFVLRTDQAGWEEWKPENQLRKRAFKGPFPIYSMMGNGFVHQGQCMLPASAFPLVSTAKTLASYNDRTAAF